MVGDHDDVAGVVGKGSEHLLDHLDERIQRMHGPAVQRGIAGDITGHVVVLGVDPGMQRALPGGGHDRSQQRTLGLGITGQLVLVGVRQALRQIQRTPPERSAHPGVGLQVLLRHCESPAVTGFSSTPRAA